jgi:hypothetical protein
MHRACDAWVSIQLRLTRETETSCNNNSFAKGVVMKQSLTESSQEPKLTARVEEGTAKRLMSECTYSSPRASLAFSALAVVRTLREMAGDLYRRFARGGTSEKIYGSVRYSPRS